MLTILTLLPFALCMYAGLDIALEIEYRKEGEKMKYTISTTTHDSSGKQIANYPGYDLTADNICVAMLQAVKWEKELLSCDDNIKKGSIETMYNKIYYTDVAGNEFYVVVYADNMEG